MSFADFLSNLESKPELRADIACGCRTMRPLEDLFLSKNESEESRLICDHCAESVIDTYFCGRCLNSYFSSVAINNLNRCLNCLACPRCDSTLVSVSNGDSMYMECACCHWDSKGIGMVGASMPEIYEKVKGQKKVAHSEFTRLSHLFAAKHKEGLTLEDDEVEKGRAMDKFSTRDTDAAVQRIESHLADTTNNLWRLPKEPVANDLSDEARKTTQPQDVVTSAQRLANPGFASYSMKESWPQFGLLSTKMGYRDPVTEKFVVKPQAGAAKVTFDKENFALSYLPRVTLQDLPAFVASKSAKFKLVFRNPLSVGVSVHLEQTDKFLASKAAADDGEDEGLLDDDENKAFQPTVMALSTTSTIAFSEKPFPLGAFTPTKDGDAKNEENISKVEVTVVPGADSKEIKLSFVVVVDVQHPDVVGFTSLTYQMQLCLGTA